MSTRLPREILLMIAEHAISDTAPSSRPERKAMLWNLCRTCTLFADFARRHLFEMVALQVGTRPRVLEEFVDFVSQPHIVRNVRTLLISVVDEKHEGNRLERITKFAAKYATSSDDDNEEYGEVISLAKLAEVGEEMVCCVDNGDWIAQVSVHLTRLMAGCTGKLEMLVLQFYTGDVCVNRAVPLVSTVVTILSSFRFAGLKAIRLDTVSIGDLAPFWQIPRTANKTLSSNLKNIQGFELGDAAYRNDAGATPAHTDRPLRGFTSWLPTLPLRALRLTNMPLRVQPLTPLTPTLTTLYLTCVNIDDGFSSFLTAAKWLKHVDLWGVRLDSTRDTWASAARALLLLPGLEKIKLRRLTYRHTSTAAIPPSRHFPCAETLCTDIPSDCDVFPEVAGEFRARGGLLAAEADTWKVCSAWI